MKFATRSIHAGQPNESLTGSIATPIFQTSTFSQESAGEPRTYHGRQLNYGRTENPTRIALEEALADLEEGFGGLAFSSGLAAVNAVLLTLKQGDRVVASSDLYGGTYRMFTTVFAKYGITFDFIDTTHLSNLEAALKTPATLLWLETPSNPLINVTDIEAAANLAKSKGVKVLVDNTFATPYLQQPLKLGADIVLHSCTKFLNGHGDVLSGGIVTRDRTDWDAIKYVQNACGLIPGPQDCYLVLRGLKTLPLRMDKHCDNARRVVSWLTERDDIARIYYPGLPSHPNADIAKKQMKNAGPMVAFELKADVATSKRFLAELKLITLAESLGAAKTLICHPPTMTHASVEPDVRRAVGIADGLIRLSVGLEDAEDIIEDLDQALTAIRSASY